MGNLSTYKKSFISGLIFSGTVLGVGLAYASLNYIVSVNTATSTSVVSASEWNKIVANLNTLDSQVANSTMPTGAVVTFYGTVCPSGWSPADGNATVKKTDGTSSTLDLRGEFVRWLDTAGIGARWVDTGRNLGTSQVGTSFPSVYVYASSPTSGVLVSHPVSANSGYPNDATATNMDSRTLWTPGVYMSVGLSANGSASTVSFTSRPRNVALLYCVKN